MSHQGRVKMGKGKSVLREVTQGQCPVPEEGQELARVAGARGGPREARSKTDRVVPHVAIGLRVYIPGHLVGGDTAYTYTLAAHNAPARRIRELLPSPPLEPLASRPPTGHLETAGSPMPHRPVSPCSAPGQSPGPS